MNDPATPPSSAGLLDRLAETAEGLRRSLDENGGGSLGEVLFVMIAVHCLLRFASLYVRIKAGLTAPLRPHSAMTQRAPLQPASPKQASGAVRTQAQAQAQARENMDGVRVDDRHSGVAQDHDADTATVTAVVAPLFIASGAGCHIRRRTPPGRACVGGSVLAGSVRSRPPRFSMARGVAGYA